MAKRKEKASKMGRKNKYETHVKPRLKEVTEWRRSMTEGQICQMLGIGRTVFYEYKKEHPEFERALRTGETLLIDDLKGALIKKALGYDYTEETREMSKKDGLKTKKVTRHMPPDLGSIHLLLKNLDPQWHNDDAANLKIKQEELEIKKQRAAAEDW